MKQDSAIIFGVSALLTAAIIGGVYYMAVVKSAAEPRKVAQCEPATSNSAQFSIESEIAAKRPECGLYLCRR